MNFERYEDFTKEELIVLIKNKDQQLETLETGINVVSREYYALISKLKELVENHN